eukprot:CAMPEP_0170177864 /NCGR_PEP_ID=MMETSP0040_2-20121228/11252_1 /TAXON_ID=641309 /ORGANISM="Lotharella oceanica, Strain CCMP622" /LENGTH=276 /DNA_ID=CAMNT_0010420703 /DNA_START=30 /DNA_END=860 /DNA_ORIENTATION=+
MGANVTSRSWRILEGGKYHVVQLRHNNVSGRRILLLDGKEIWQSMKVMDVAENVHFEINGKQGVVKIGVDYFTYTYLCLYQGRPMPEMTFDIMDYKEQGYQCKIPVVNVEIVKGKKVAVFRVEMTHQGQTEVFRKRFRDFATFDDYLRGGFEGHHLLQNLPKLPPKQFTLFTNHFSKEFLEERRRGLEEYVNKLCRIPKAVANPDFVAFFTKKNKAKKKKPQEQVQDSKTRDRRTSKGRGATAALGKGSQKAKSTVRSADPRVSDGEGEGPIEVRF